LNDGMSPETIASLATAFGTLVLAVATFASVRSANMSARSAERALLEGIRPVLLATRAQDPPEKIGFADDHWVVVPGGRGSVEVTDGVVYLTVALRNVGNGLAVLHGWTVTRRGSTGEPHANPDDFRRLSRDLYIASGDVGFWQGALRDPGEQVFADVAGAVHEMAPLNIDILYGDHEGGQRVITRFSLTPRTSDAGELVWIASVSRHWNVDRVDPR
jgi:hypothetical protein